MSRDGVQFPTRLIINMIQPAGDSIPVAAIAMVALDLVQHGVNPCRRYIGFVALNNLMRSLPFAGLGVFYRPEQFIVHCAHKHCFTGSTAQVQGR